ncbi:hypothetical protein RyT2_04780 [Pseudolactococcus yaeyamensis]
MNDYQPDTKKTNHRTWKSGKKWLYGSATLMAIAGGVVLESTGITPKILSHIQKGLSTDIVSAMSTSATILLRGAVLQPDFYASVADFRVPTTVGQDFANNATIAVKGAINPYFKGSEFVIPSNVDSNAIAAFNQPLDPTKNFSISAEITVPDARIAAAGLYISDIPPEDIVSKLGVDAGNWQGSSGSLKNEKQAYDGHYMLFSGFHNDGGYAAILASGTDYTRVTGGGGPDGPSRYMDDDYVGFWWENKNVKIWATIDYSATTGIATVMFRHNSATTAAATENIYNGYTPQNKTAVVQFRIDQSSPVYLGVLGNGDKGDNNGDYTSRSIVTSVTGSYLAKERLVDFKDDGGNTIGLQSKVLMPLGGRLGIGNGDMTASYYYEKPDMPQGYTYLASQNPSVGSDKNVVVTYQRDVQTGYVERINKLTGQKIDPSRNHVFQGLTKKDMTVKVPGLSGYYYLNDITGEAKHPSYASDGSTVDFNIMMDDTANGTSRTDSQEQIIQTYMKPSVQERILTVIKPDGKISEEKQITTTDTDFSAIAGQYALPGYRAVIDGTAVTDAEANQGIPGEPTDRTNNLKSATDSVPQKHLITYQAEPQKANIVYKDATTGTILKTDVVTGLPNSYIPYDVMTCISYYLKQGYILKSNNYPQASVKFDTDSKVDQNFLVELVRDSKSQSETKDITHQVIYRVKNNLVPAPQNEVTKAKITHTYFVDQVTGSKITSQFSDYAVNGVINDSPKAPKYTSDHPKVGVDSSGVVTFPPPVPHKVQDHVPTITENSTINYHIANPVHTLTSTVLYVLDDAINVTIPTDTIFYNKTTDVIIRAPAYTIKNNSGVPVKVSVDGFTPSVKNPAVPADFALNLNVTGKKVTTPSTKLIEKGLSQTASNELLILANCLDQYGQLDPTVVRGSAVNNVAKFTFGGSATALGVRKLDYTLSLRFDKTPF